MQPQYSMQFNQIKNFNMKKVLLISALLASVFFISITASAQNDQKAAVEKLIFSYRDALNASDANKVEDNEESPLQSFFRGLRERLSKLFSNIF